MWFGAAHHRSSAAIWAIRERRCGLAVQFPADPIRLVFLVVESRVKVGPPTASAALWAGSDPWRLGGSNPDRSHPLVSYCSAKRRSAAQHEFVFLVVQSPHRDFSTPCPLGVLGVLAVQSSSLRVFVVQLARERGAAGRSCPS